MPEINHRKQETPELKLYTTSRQLWTCQITPLNKIKFIAFAQVGESKAVFACIYGPGGGGDLHVRMDIQAYPLSVGGNHLPVHNDGSRRGAPSGGPRQYWPTPFSTPCPTPPSSTLSLDLARTVHTFQ